MALMRSECFSGLTFLSQFEHALDTSELSIFIEVCVLDIIILNTCSSFLHAGDKNSFRN